MLKLATAFIFFCVISIGSSFAQVNNSPTRCVILGLVNNCKVSSDPRLINGIWYDNEKDASTNPETCKLRAREFFEWCNSKAPVTSQFFKDGVLKSETRYPVR